MPWFEDIVQAVGPRHDLSIYDPGRPLADQFQGIDGVIDYGGKVGTREMADIAAGKVRLWQIITSGYEHFDLAYWKQKKIPVANTPGHCSGPALAECALMLMLLVARRWNEGQAGLRQGDIYKPLGSELGGRQLGLIGFGASACELARRVRPFQMRVSAIDVREVSQREQEDLGLGFVGKPGEMDRVIAESDYVSLHLHLNKETHHIMDGRRIGLMKKSAYLINVARGGLVDEEALYAALRDGRIGGAGLDVFAMEPLDPNSPLFKLPNVVATPHIAGVTDGTSRRRAAFAGENMDRIAAGLEPLGRIDL